MARAYVCDDICPPIGRHAGALAPLRTDDLAAIPLTARRVRIGSGSIRPPRSLILALSRP